MPDWNILIADNLEERGLSILRAAARVDNRAGISADELLAVVADFDGMIIRGRTRVTAAVLEAASRLKVVGRAGVGVDNIDLGCAQSRGVIVVNAPVATTTAVAEHTLALMLALARSVPRADAALKSGRWIKSELRGMELAGKTLGVLGVGNIGSEVARRAIPFGMTVLGHDLYKTGDQIQACGAQPVPISELFARSDYLSLHIPLTPETRGMIDGQALAGMKRGVRILSTARGGIIDETALLAALESGQVAGAALDVFANEPPGLTALVAHPSVVATPHTAGQTVESQDRAAEDIATEVLAALSGSQLRWQVV